MVDPLKSLAARAEGDLFFLAPLLAAYAASEELDDAGLADALGGHVGDLNMIRLCRAPRSEPEEFRDDVARIAERFALDPDRLADAVQRGRVVIHLRAARHDSGSPLMAARDAEPGPPPEEPEAP